MRAILFRVMTVCLGVVVAGLFLLLTEGVFRSLHLRPVYLGPQFEVSSHKPKPVKPNVSTHIPVRLPETANAPHPWGGLLVSPHRLFFSPVEIFDFDSEIGGIQKPNQKNIALEVFGDGGLSYQVTYNIDSFRRRVTPTQSDDRFRDHDLIFAGCSFTFGQGLEDDQTIPSQVARLQHSDRVYNYGIMGAGPNTLLRWFEKSDFGSDLRRGRRIQVVYIYIDDQMRRLLGTLDTYRASRQVRDRPYYSLDSNGKLVSRGMLSQRTWTDPWFRLLSKSELLTYFHVDLPPRVTSEHLRLFAEVLKASQAEIAAKLGGEVDFTVVIFPGESNEIIPYLDERGIRSLDYSGVDLSRYVRGPVLLPGLHPTAETANFMAQQIVNDLGLAAGTVSRLKPNSTVSKARPRTAASSH